MIRAKRNPERRTGSAPAIEEAGGRGRMGGWPMSHMHMETWQRRVGTSRLAEWQAAGSSRIRCLVALAAVCEKVERDEPGKHPQSNCSRRVGESGRDDGDHRGGQRWDPEVGDPEAVVRRGGGGCFLCRWTWWRMLRQVLAL